jgi:DNA-directed RNA polymerase beta subunit
MALAVDSPRRVSFARLGDVLPMPNLIEMQLTSFEWFQTEGLQELIRRNLANPGLLGEDGAGLQRPARALRRAQVQ